VVALNRQRRWHPKPSRGQTPIYGSDRWKKNRSTTVYPGLMKLPAASCGLSQNSTSKTSRK
jgi:hypothetical protein